MKIGDRVRKKNGSSWQGIIVGSYSTKLTPVGWAVESETEAGSVQIYPEQALALIKIDDDIKKTIDIYYKNYRGDEGWREIYPMSIRYGSSKWHPIEQWLLKAYDINKKAEREFAILDIRKWI